MILNLFHNVSFLINLSLLKRAISIIEENWGCEFDGNEFRIVDLEKAYPVIVDNYKNHNGNQWYEFKNYTIDWTSGQTHPDEFRYE